MKHVKASFLLLLILSIMLVIGCLGNQQAVTPIDRALMLHNQYQAMETTYKNQYVLASDTEKEWLSKNVAPTLDQMRFMVIRYSDLALDGDDSIDTRLEVIRLARLAALKLTKEIME